MMREFQRSSAVTILAGLLLVPLLANAAELFFSPASGTFANGGEFSIKVSVDPKGENINASDGTVTFDPALASVVSISKDGSVFSLWTADPSFSNSAGTVSFSGGTPSAFATKGTIATIKFRAKAEGSLKLGFKDGSILAADGKGTNVYKGGIESTYTIGPAAAKAPPPAQTTPAPPTGGFLAGGDPPIAPSISSPTHPKSDAWYSTTTMQFTWKPPADADAIRTILSQSESDTPNEVRENVNDPLTLVASADGVWFLIAQYRNEFGWGESGIFKVQIDTTPPDEFEFAFLAPDGATPARFEFAAADSLSGVDRYQILYGDTVAATVRAQDMTDGTTPAPPTEGGAMTVTIKAFDKAGNSRDSVKELTMPVVARASARGAEETEQQSPWTSERIVTIIFAFIIGALSSIMVYTRNQAAREKERLIDRLSGMADKFDRIFASMREEFEQMVNDFDEKPQLTPQEREMLEHIKEVIDISEELVDTDMGELKRTVRGQ